MKVDIITCVADLAVRVPKQGLMPTFFYRGHTKASQKLIPSLFRYNAHTTGYTDWEQLELALRSEFDAKHIALTTERALSPIDQICLARHHGLPTRLLDWSENAFIALFFAVEGNSSEEDSILWEFGPPHILHGAPGTEDRITDLSVFSARHTNRRVAAQAGRFSWHSAPNGTDIFVALEHRTFINFELNKIIIPHKQREAIKDELNSIRISYETLFPDLDGLCRQLAWQLDKEQGKGRKFRKNKI